MNKRKITPLNVYLAFMLLVLGYYGYSTWNGITYWEDTVERNTEYNSNNRSHSSYGPRFYHK